MKNIAYKTTYGAKARITSDKVDGYIRKYDGTKYLALFHSDKKLDRISIELDILTEKAIFQTFIFIYENQN